MLSQKSQIRWYTVNDIEKLIQESPRPVFIDTYTDWCGWCKKFDSDTFTNPVIADILNNKFYAIKFNAEGKDSVTFMGRTFINDGKYGVTHQLGVALLKGQMSYPTVVFLNEKGQLVSPVPGFREPKEMEVLLSFFAEKVYEKQNYEDYAKAFKGKVK
jgi:thioredoxin-related protein